MLPSTSRYGVAFAKGGAVRLKPHNLTLDEGKDEGEESDGVVIELN